MEHILITTTNFCIFFSSIVFNGFSSISIAGFNSDFDRAVESLDQAISVLQKRVENLKAEKESKDPAKAKDAFYTR